MPEKSEYALGIIAWIILSDERIAITFLLLADVAVAVGITECCQRPLWGADSIALQFCVMRFSRHQDAIPLASARGTELLLLLLMFRQSQHATYNRVTAGIPISNLHFNASSRLPCLQSCTVPSRPTQLSRVAARSW